MSASAINALILQSRRWRRDCFFVERAGRGERHHAYDKCRHPFRHESRAPAGRCSGQGSRHCRTMRCLPMCASTGPTKLQRVSKGPPISPDFRGNLPSLLAPLFCVAGSFFMHRCPLGAAGFQLSSAVTDLCLSRRRRLFAIGNGDG